MRGAVILPSKHIDNTYGQLGIVSKDNIKVFSHPKPCSLNIRIKSIACGEEHTALLTCSFVGNT